MTITGRGRAALTWTRLGFEDVDWDELDAFPDRTIFQRQAWLAFVADTQGAEPVVAALHQDGAVVGYFTGLVVRKLGLRVLGSPFSGWTTSYMGFNLRPGVSRRSAMGALADLAFGQLGCSFVQLFDRYLEPGDVPSSYQVRMEGGYLSDLTASEDAIFASMTSACRRCIRKAAKSGVAIEEADDADFARDFHTQLRDVFAKQQLAPTYRLDRVEKLVEHLGPTGQLLRLRARDADGRCIATGIYPAFGDFAFFWGNASERRYQHLRPNEAINWYAMRYWKARGIRHFDWGGGGDYKAKYGGRHFEVPLVSGARFPLLADAVRLAEAAYYGGREAQASLRRHWEERRRPASPTSP